ncbi:patched domain-containing 2 isoform X2 [Pelobates cultripes]|uniref:Patched domain-containing 2 isoform X2 n=1 Tax=Pelobates cultripes TaxID=61616 RepID=A0AAD1T7W4_PELCU|nr:patched domain-containing 2 isoform X2 [Pelobates cultripes]
MDIDDPLLQDAWLDEEENEVTFQSPICTSCQWTSKPLNDSLTPCGFWNFVGWVFTNPYCASFLLALGCLVPIALSVIMFVHYPTLDIDISYNAFEIRNHESSQRFDSLTLALKSQFGTWGRNRRDVADFTSEALQHLITEQLQQLHLNISQQDSAERVRRSLVWQNNTARTNLTNTVSLNPISTTVNQSRHIRGVSKGDIPGTYVTANTQSHAHWRIELIFLARGDDENNIFTKERLMTIHRIERKIMDHPHYREFCWKPHEILKDLPLGSYSYCSPPSSLLTYFFPTEKGGKIYYDGMGQDLADVHGSLKLAMTHPEFYWYVDEGLTTENMKSSLLRSEILFGAPLPNYYSVEDRWEEQQRKFQSFVTSYISILSKESTSKVQVLYGGTDLFDYEVRTTFNNDMLLAFISSSCIAILVYILTSWSVFLSFFGIASIGLSCLVALFLYHVVFGIQYLGILNGVAAFVIVGIGVDDVFVFINTYRQAAHLKDPRLRMIHTVQTAGKATFFTSLTTASAYAANIFSQIPAVHDFGLFMSLIVSCCWVAVLFIMPAALGIWGAYICPLESSCHSNCSERCLKNNSLDIYEDLLLAQDASPRSVQGDIHYLDDDIPLLTVDEDPVSIDFGDVPLVSVLPDKIDRKSETDKRDQVIRWLQAILHHCVLWTTVKGRYITVGLFVAVLILSIAFATRLHPASRAPVLFRPDTNIQLLLDLKYNLSAEGISCVTCSGLFQEKPRSLQNNIRTSSEKKKRGSISQWSSRSSGDPGHQALADLQRTVYVTRCKWEGRVTIYRLSFNATTTAPWQPVTPGADDVSLFQVYKVPYGNFTRKLTACVSTIGLQSEACPKKWMLTSSACDTRRGWKADFTFYVADKEQRYSRKLYFAFSHKNPSHGRICSSSPSCLPGSGSDGGNKGVFYVPNEKGPPRKISPTLGFNPCLNTACGKPAVRPLVDTGAMVFVVFGIQGINRTRAPDNHVLGELGRVIYDDKFDLFKEIGNLCRLCKVISSNGELVKPGGAQCLPSGYSISSFLQMLHPECANIPEPNLLPGQLSHGAVGVKDGKVQWVSMAFESTTYKGKSSFQTYKDYLRWETFLQEQLLLLPADSALKRGFQTCGHWKQIFMEIIGVQSALYGLILSLVICVAAVAIFTTHVLLLIPVLLTILGVVCLVVTIMYWLGWEMGAVEAISLSILVGSSVDYCVHLVEGYLLAGESLPLHLKEDAVACRQWRASEAVRHVGVAIVSSAITTVIATIPLFFCIIAPFAKFGKIVALNTGISILYTLVVSTALLSIMGPSTFVRTRTSFLKAALAAAVSLAGCICVYITLLKSGLNIPVLNGSPP